MNNEKLKIRKVSIWTPLVLCIFVALDCGFNMHTVALCLTIFVSLNLTITILSYSARKNSFGWFIFWATILVFSLQSINWALIHYAKPSSIINAAALSSSFAAVIVILARLLNVALVPTTAFESQTET